MRRAASGPLPAGPAANAQALTVELRWATLPPPLHGIAIHCWFAVFQAGAWTRWEVWQHPDAGGTAFGHVHRNLLPVDAGVGGGPAHRERTWHGADAHRLVAALARAPAYPCRHRYRAWPGPNSNTFARWVLEAAGLDLPLDPRAIGKDYVDTVALRPLRSARGLALDTAVGGAAFTRHRVELHLLGFTLGVAWWPPALVTPVGVVPVRDRDPVVPSPTPCRDLG